MLNETDRAYLFEVAAKMKVASTLLDSKSEDVVIVDRAVAILMSYAIDINDLEHALGIKVRSNEL